MYTEMKDAGDYLEDTDSSCETWYVGQEYQYQALSICWLLHINISSMAILSTWSAIMRTRISEVDSGPRLNIKTVLSTYGDFHVKDKTAVRTSYL